MSRLPALLFRDARLVDGLSDEPIDGAALLVVDGRIAEIGTPGLPTPDLPDLRVIDLAGRTVMPGLIDAHVHPTAVEVIEDFQRPMPTSLRTLVAKARLEAMLRRGFTTVRDAGGCDAGLRLATERGLIDGPRLFVAGKALSQTGGHGDERTVTDVDPPDGSYPGEFARIADGVDGVRLAARQELRRGADQIKICASGGVMSATDPVDMTQYSEDELRAIVEEARVAPDVRHGARLRRRRHRPCRRAAACAPSSTATSSTPRPPRPSSRTTRSWCPRWSPTRASSAMAAKPASTPGAWPRTTRSDGPGWLPSPSCGRRARGSASGPTCSARSHELQPLEFSIRAEVESAADIVRSATSVNADLLRRPDLGRIEVGATADLIVVDGDPLADIGVLARPETTLRMVVTEGRVRLDDLA